MLLVAVATSLVLVAFLVPLALLVRSVAADRATSAATREAEALAPLVGTLDRSTVALAVDQLAHDDSSDFPLTVFFPDGTVLGSRAPRDKGVALASTGRSLTVQADGGREVLVAVQGGKEGTAVIRAFVSSGQLHHGVARTWAILAGLAASLLALSLLVAARLARSITRPIDDLVGVAHRLADGDLSARAAGTGAAELRAVAGALNLLADRIGELLAAERESVADLSHRMRTPLTALRLGVESVTDAEQRARLGDAVDELEDTVDRVIREARRPVREGVGASADAAAVARDRVGFWSTLAEDERREMHVDIPDEPLPVKATAEDLRVLLDALFGNVFTHTEQGTPLTVGLRGAHDAGAVLVVGDAGPGFPDDVDDRAAARGASGNGSTGLGLDIARRTATASGGHLVLGRSSAGGAQVTVTLGAPGRGRA